jgi:ABC-2 type transport system permease protein
VALAGAGILILFTLTLTWIAVIPGLTVRAFADNQPVTSIVNTIHDLFARQPVSGDIWTALAWCLGLLVLAYAFAMTVYRRKIA